MHISLIFTTFVIDERDISQQCITPESLAGQNLKFMFKKVCKKLEEIKKTYQESDICMGELLEDVSADGLSIDAAFYLYMAAIQWAEGDRFFRVLAGCEDKEEVDLSEFFNTLS